MGRTIFDVGANDGASSIPCALQGDTVYAFEPNPDLAAALRKRTAGMATYHVIETAVSNTPGRRPFFVAGWEDSGCSSLRERTPYAEVAFRGTWPGRPNFDITSTPVVEVIQLESFVRMHAIEKIDHLHIDAQGEDLDVLLSIGPLISIVEAGVIEVATSRELAIYEGQATLDEAVAFLKQHEFKSRWSPNGNSHEFNVHFER